MRVVVASDAGGTGEVVDKDADTDAREHDGTVFQA